MHLVIKTQKVSRPANRVMSQTWRFLQKKTFKNLEILVGNFFLTDEFKEHFKSDFFKSKITYFIDPNNVGPKCKKFSEVTKIWADEKFRLVLF